MKRIIVDTNVWMAISEFKLDLFTALEQGCEFNYQIYLLSGIIEELQEIFFRQRGKHKRAAKLALDIIRTKEISVIKDVGNVDDLLVAYSKKDYLVLTLDTLLKRRLAKPYLIIRQKRSVVLVE